MSKRHIIQSANGGANTPSELAQAQWLVDWYVEYGRSEENIDGLSAFMLAPEVIALCVPLENHDRVVMFLLVGRPKAEHEAPTAAEMLATADALESDLINLNHYRHLFARDCKHSELARFRGVDTGVRMMNDDSGPWAASLLASAAKTAPRFIVELVLAFEIKSRKSKGRA